MTNRNDRRSFLGFVFAAAAGLAALPLWLKGQQPLPKSQRSGPPPLPPPFQDQKPQDREPEIKPDPHAQLKENQKNIKKDVERLAQLAEELKKEVEKTDSADVLSLQMVRKAEEIEKLARQIKNLARG